MSGYNFARVPQKVPFVETRYRRIKTEIPVPESIAIFEDLNPFSPVNAVY